MIKVYCDECGKLIDIEIDSYLIYYGKYKIRLIPDNCHLCSICINNIIAKSKIT